jgi:hypothetical protein
MHQCRAVTMKVSIDSPPSGPFKYVISQEKGIGSKAIKATKKEPTQICFARDNPDPET